MVSLHPVASPVTRNMEAHSTLVAAVCLVALCVSTADAWLFWRNYPSARANGKGRFDNNNNLADFTEYEMSLYKSLIVIKL